MLQMKKNHGILKLAQQFQKQALNVLKSTIQVGVLSLTFHKKYVFQSHVFPAFSLV